MMSALGLLRAQWERACERLLARLDGLTDEEYRWEPVADCWNVRPDPRTPSGWTVDYPDVEPDPPPFTTIAWRMLHVSDGNTIYWEHAFGPAQRSFTDLAPHGTAAGAIAYLAVSQLPVTTTLGELVDEQLEERRSTPWGERWSAGRVLAVLLDEQVHHGAEIALLRDLYRSQPAGRRSRSAST
jgi:DinB superfamily